MWWWHRVITKHILARKAIDRVNLYGHHASQYVEGIILQYWTKMWPCYQVLHFLNFWNITLNFSYFLVIAKECQSKCITVSQIYFYLMKYFKSIHFPSACPCANILSLEVIGLLIDYKQTKQTVFKVWPQLYVIENVSIFDLGVPSTWKCWNLQLCQVFIGIQYIIIWFHFHIQNCPPTFLTWNQNSDKTP